MKILENVVIKDKEGLFEKIQNMKKEGLDNLYVISDFEKTFNKELVNERKFKSPVSLIRDGGYLENNYPERSYALYDKYNPIEVDFSIPLQIRKEKMYEWCSTHIKLMSECKMNKKVIEEIIKEEGFKLREYLDIFLKELFQSRIPLIIFSSGIGDIIDLYLKEKNLLYSNISVISNYYQWDENGFAKPYYKGNKIIHCLNKEDTEIKDTPSYNLVKDRKNVIVIGDSLEDSKMAINFKYNNIISIGFLNSDIEEKLEIYKNTFDIVITKDGSFKQILELLNELKI